MAFLREVFVTPYRVSLNVIGGSGGGTFRIVVDNFVATPRVLLAADFGGGGGGGRPSCFTSALIDFLLDLDFVEVSEWTVGDLRGGGGTVTTFVDDAIDSVGGLVLERERIDAVGGLVLVRERIDTEGAGG